MTGRIRNLRHAVRLFIGLLVLAAFAWLGRRYLAALPATVADAWGALLLVSVLFVGMKACMAEAFRAALARLGCRVTYLRCFALVMAMTFANQFVPKSGLGVPAVYLKTVHGLEFARFSALFLPITVLQFTAGSLLGAVAVLMTSDQSGSGGTLLFLVLFGMLFVGSASVLVVPFPTLPERIRRHLPRFVVRFAEGWEILRTDRGLLIHVFAAQCGVLLLRALRLYVAYRAVGGTPSFAAATAVSILAQYALLIGLTPGSLGFREAAITLTRDLAGVGKETAALAALFDRSGMVLAAFCVGGPLIVFLARKMVSARKTAGA